MKPEYDAGKNLKERMESAVALYDLRALDDMFKQAEVAPEMTLEEINAEIADVRSARSHIYHPDEVYHITVAN